MDVTARDVLLAGGGGAGLRAAIAVSEINPHLRIVVSKVYPRTAEKIAAPSLASPHRRTGIALLANFFYSSSTYK